MGCARVTCAGGCTVAATLSWPYMLIGWHVHEGSTDASLGALSLDVSVMHWHEGHARDHVRLEAEADPKASVVAASATDRASLAAAAAAAATEASNGSDTRPVLDSCSFTGSRAHERVVRRLSALGLRPGTRYQVLLRVRRGSSNRDREREGEVPVCGPTAAEGAAVVLSGAALRHGWPDNGELVPKFNE